MSFSPGETLTIPSPIDVHTHLRQPGGEDMETIESGTRAALAGGFQLVFDMPNNPNGNQTWSLERLNEKIKIARYESWTHIGFYAGVNLEDPAVDELPRMLPRAAGLKLYMGETTGNVKTYGLEAARSSIDTWINAAPPKGQSRPPILLHARTDIGYETADYIASRGFPVHWCHIASEIEVDYLRDLRQKHPDYVTAGVTPHHLTMTHINADFQQGWNGARMQPPLGKEVDHDSLLYAYNDGTIQIIETDHAPHPESSKLKAEAENPTGETGEDCVTCYGISGIEFVLPVLMAAVQRGKISMERLVDSLHTQPARMLQLNTERKTETVLRIGPYIIGEDDRAGKSKNNPYIGWTAGARVETVTPRFNKFVSKIIKTGDRL